MKKFIAVLLLTISVTYAIDGGWYIGAGTDSSNELKIYKIGYLRDDNSGRAEGYYKEDSPDNFDIRTIGIRGERTFLPFGDSSDILPFTSAGFGLGSLSGVDNTLVLEYEFGVGVHYFIHKDIDILGGFFWRFTDINIDDEDGDTYHTSTSNTNIEIGINYHF